MYKNKFEKYNQKINKILYGGNYDPRFIQRIVEFSRAISRYNDSEYTRWDFEGGEFISNMLDINNDVEKITNIFTRANYLELRKYNGEKTLVIACGNRRIDDTNLNLYQSDTNYEYAIDNIHNRINDNQYHSHRNAYTIDMTLVANPSIVAEFNGTLNFSLSLPDNSFDYIIFEGGGRPWNNDSEIQRLLNKNNLSFCICNGEGGYIVYSYYDYGQYHIANFLPTKG